MYTFIANYEHIETLEKREEIINIPHPCVDTEKDAYLNAMDMAYNMKEEHERIVSVEFIGSTSRKENESMLNNLRIALAEELGAILENDDEVDYKYNYDNKNIVDVVISNKKRKEKYIFSAYDKSKGCFTQGCKLCIIIR